MNRGELWAGQLGGRGGAGGWMALLLRTELAVVEQSASALPGGGRGPAQEADPGEGQAPARNRFLTPPLVLQRQNR